MPSQNQRLLYRLSLKTKPTDEPITLKEAQDWLHVTNTDDDAVIQKIIKGVREITELVTDRRLRSQTWLMFLDHWPSVRHGISGHHHGHDGRHGLHISSGIGTVHDAVTHHGGKHDAIELPYSPLTAVNSVRSFDEDNVATVFAATNYHVFTYTDEAPDRGRIVLKAGVVPPTPIRSGDGIEIDFTVGYTCVPASIELVMLEEIAFRYENRGDCPTAKFGSHAGKEFRALFKKTRMY